MHKTSLASAQFCGKVSNCERVGSGEAAEGVPNPEVGVSLVYLRTREKATPCGCCTARRDSGRRYCRKIRAGWGVQLR